MSSNLTNLVLSGCVNLTDLSMVTIGKLTYLKSLDVSKCIRLTDQGFSYFSQGKTKDLKCLNISACEHITDKSLKIISETFGSTLNSVLASDLILISDCGIEQLTRSSIFLKFLDLSFCPKLTPLCLTYLECCSLEVRSLLNYQLT